MLREQHRFFRSVLISCDLTLIAGACVLAYFVRFQWYEHLIPLGHSSTFQQHALPVEVVTPLMLMAMFLSNLYEPRRDQRFYYEAIAIFKAVVLGVGMSIIALSLFRNQLFGGQQYSGWQYAIFAGLAFSLLFFWRFIFRSGLRFMRRRGWNLRHVAVIGTGRLGQAVVHTLRRNSWTGITPAFFIRHQSEVHKKKCMGLPVHGTLEELEDICARHDISGVLIALPGEHAATLPDVLLQLEKFPYDVRVIPDVNPKYMPINLAFNELDGMPILTVRQSPMAHGWGRILKRSLDIAGSLAGIAIFSIPMLIIALLVRRSGDGGVIFHQQRTGLNGKVFHMFKFRTMRPATAEEIAAEKEIENIDEETRKASPWGTKNNDNRITSFGRFLRRTSLDELPQLFNVLRGDMSLVGPRPEESWLIETFREDWRGYMLRQNVKSGMTGWAQVNGLRGEDTNLKKRLQYDMFYIRNWSIFFDIRILWMTVFRGFAQPSPQS